MTFVHFIKSYISSGFHPLYNSSIEKQASYYNNPVLLVRMVLLCNALLGVISPVCGHH